MLCSVCVCEYRTNDSIDRRNPIQTHETIPYLHPVRPVVEKDPKRTSDI